MMIRFVIWQCSGYHYVADLELQQTACYGNRQSADDLMVMRRARLQKSDGGAEYWG